jgi:hypothetical protein
MSASDAIGKQFYHGTWAGWLRKGQLIRPASDLLSTTFGMRNFKISSPHHVYITENPEDAQWYAEQGYRNIDAMGHRINDIPIHGARPVVYRVEPRGSLEPDTSLDIQDRKSYRLLGNAKILDRHWVGKTWDEH